MRRLLVAFAALAVATIAVGCGGASEEAEPAVATPTAVPPPTATAVEVAPALDTPAFNRGGAFVPLDSPDVVAAQDAGFMSPTEAAAVAVVYSFFLAVVLYKKVAPFFFSAALRPRSSCS